MQHGRLLVLKDGIHAFMFQPGVCTVFRKEALQFAAAANWDGPQPVPEPGASSGAEPAKDSIGTGTGTAAGTADADAAAEHPVMAPPKAVGVGVVLENVLAQFKPVPKSQ